MEPGVHEAAHAVALERVRDIRLESRLPTPPILEIGFYAFALLIGVGLGSVATLVAHVTT